MRIQYSGRCHKSDIGIGSSPISYEGFVQSQKGQGKAKLNHVMIFITIVIDHNGFIIILSLLIVLDHGFITIIVSDTLV